jgi:hypothetical protein
MSEIKELADRVAAIEKRLAVLEQGTQSNAGASGKEEKQLSVKEFILSKNPTSAVEKTLAIAYFVERFGRMASFNVDDLTHHFQLAKEPIPGNINASVDKNVAKGLIAEAKEKKDKKKAWIVTNSGEKVVEKGFKE